MLDNQPFIVFNSVREIKNYLKRVRKELDKKNTDRIYWRIRCIKTDWVLPSYERRKAHKLVEVILETMYDEYEGKWRVTASAVIGRLK